LLLLWQKKQHTLKCQLVIEQATGRVVCTFFGKGRRHDFKLFQASGVHFHPETVESLQDKGYQGIQKLHVNSRLPKRNPEADNSPLKTLLIASLPVNSSH